MATFVAAIGSGLSAIGGGSAVGGAALVASTAATGLSAYSQYQSGKAQAAEADQARQVEKIKASEAAIERRERLVRALAQQNARVGASGITQSGSPTQVMLEDVDQFEREDMAQSTLDRMRDRNYRTASKTARKSGATTAGVSLLSGAANTYAAFGK